MAENNPPSKKTLTAVQSRKRLAIVWFCGAGLLLALLVLQSVFGHYQEQTTEAWGWFLPTVMPTLSLITGVLVMDALGKEEEPQTVDPFFYKLSLIFSGIYLALVAFSILIQPFTALSPLKLMNQSNLWLAPLQGLVAAFLGIFFVKKRPF